MKAVRWHARGDIRYEEVDDSPCPGSYDMQVEVAYCGICGTDLEEYDAGPIFIPTKSAHPLSHRMAPMILGHEFSGIVVAVGDHVQGYAVGDHVASDALLYCGDCESCHDHQYNLCDNLAALGLMADGGLAQYVTAPAKSFRKVPVSVPLQEAALLEPLAVAVRALRQAHIRPGEDLLIMGAGPIGLMVLLAAKISGVGTITVAEPAAFRAEMAQKLGATEIYRNIDAIGLRFHKAIDCTGQPAAQIRALKLLKSRGRLVLVGVPTITTELDTLEIINNEKEIVGALSHIVDEDFAAAIQFMSDGRVDVKPLISIIWPLARAEEAFQMLKAGQSDIIKILLAPLGTG